MFKIKQLYQNTLKKFRLKYENNNDHLIGSNPFLSSLIIILYSLKFQKMMEFCCGRYRKKTLI